MNPGLLPKENYLLPRCSPLCRAMTMAVAYAVLCAIYIAYSTWFAVRFAQSTQQLGIIETVKGILFVLATALLFFLAAYVWWKRIQRRDELLVQLERRAVASMFNATLAHDLNNLLMSLQGLLEMAKNTPTPRKSTPKRR